MIASNKATLHQSSKRSDEFAMDILSAVTTPALAERLWEITNHDSETMEEAYTLIKATYDKEDYFLTIRTMQFMCSIVGLRTPPAIDEIVNDGSLMKLYLSNVLQDFLAEMEALETENDAECD